MRRLLLALAALAAAACSRDLDVPLLLETPPRIDSVAVVGLEPQAVTSGLRVLGGELLAVRGAGFSADVAELEVRIGGVDAEVLDAAQDRIVARVPSLAAFGAVDIQVRTPVGFRTQAGALQYEGSGKPLGFGVSDLPTSVDLGFVAPVQPPGDFGFSDLAIATGASDSALLLVPAAGVAATTIPLGLVPVSAAARFVADGPDNVRIQVLAFGRAGEVALGTAVLDGGASAVNRIQARPLVSQVSPASCTNPQVLFTYGGTPGGKPIPVAAWIEEGPLGSFQQKVATIDADAATTTIGAAEFKPKGPVWPVDGAIVGWAPWGTDSVVFATSSVLGGEIWLYDAAALPPTPPTRLTFVPGGGPGLPVRVSDYLSALCPAGPLFFYSLAAATDGVSEALAVGYRSGVTDRVALVNVTAGTVNVGVAGTIPTSLALVPDPPFATASWAVLAAGITNLYRFRPLAGAPACQNLVSDAALPLSSTPGSLPTFGGMTAAANGTRVLATTPDHDLITVLPPSLTSAGPVARFASYGGVSIQQAIIGGSVLPIAVAEHATAEGALSSLDTGSALLVVSLAGDGGAVALGGSGYGRGAVWLDQPGPGSSIAYTGDLPRTSSLSFVRGGAAAVTGFAPGQCAGEDVRIESSRPVVGGPDLMAQGPARAGALGPAGVARFGPAAPPVYGVKGKDLAVYVPGSGNIACLAGDNPDWTPGQCAPDQTLDLAVEPLDVTFSAGDRSAAIRTLDPACVAASTVPVIGRCAQDDLVCLRDFCPPASELRVVDAISAVPVAVPLPAPPAALAADRGGGFLVTLRCDAGSDATGQCFLASDLCDQLASADRDDGALVRVAEDGSSVDCLAVLPALAGPLAVTPNGVEAWVTGTTPFAQFLSRLALPRRTSDGAIDTTLPVTRVSFEQLGSAAQASGALAPGGLSFTPDGSTGIVTVPGEFRILLYQ